MMTIWRFPPLILVAAEVFLAFWLVSIEDVALVYRAASAAMIGCAALILQMVWWNQTREEN
jgi:hypothetical protein